MKNDLGSGKSINHALISITEKMREALDNKKSSQQLASLLTSKIFIFSIFI